MSLISIPIFNNFDDDRQPVAVMASWIDWAMYFELVLPESVQGIHVVLLDSCGEFFTFAILGERVAFLGSGDLHNHDFNNHRISAKFEDGQYIVDGTKLGLSLNQGVCNIRIDVYLLQAFYNSNKTNMPLVPTQPCWWQSSLSSLHLCLSCMITLSSSCPAESTEIHGNCQFSFPPKCQRMFNEQNNKHYQAICQQVAIKQNKES